jgi:hypothetical protein
MNEGASDDVRTVLYEAQPPKGKLFSPSKNEHRRFLPSSSFLWCDTQHRTAFSQLQPSSARASNTILLYSNYYIMDHASKRRTLWLVFLGLVWFAAAKSNTPASTALQLHKLYTQSPPHDKRLYDVLQVSPNATAAQITKSYRRLALQHHPDKISSNDSGARDVLDEVQQAYGILKEDATRLPYHQYGLTDPNVAVLLLLGPQKSTNHLLDDSIHHELLQLMGYDDGDGHPRSGTAVLDPAARRQRRVRLVAARFVERLRPLVEDTVDSTIMAHRIAQECDRMKRLPLGAQIVRCVGRAYRHAGQDYLKQQVHPTNKKKDHSVLLRQQWRQAKHFCTAVWASGRATVTEQVWTRQEKRRRRNHNHKKDTTPTIEYHSELGEIGVLEDDEMFSDAELDIFNPLEEEEIRHGERFKAKQTLLTSLQVEALWKVAKIDLDQTIRQACHLILQGDYFFFPSHQSMNPSRYGSAHGWVTASGEVLHAEDARRKAAEAMVLIGNIMVQRSKQGTAWKE